MRTSTFGKNLKNVRDAAHLTQIQLADAIGVTQNTVWNWENRGRIPRTREVISTLCDALSCTEQDLFGYTDGYTAKQANGLVPFTSKTSAPVVGFCAAGEPREAIEQSGETHWCPPSLLEEHPDGFFLVVSGDSMDKVLPEGSYAFVVPEAVSSGDIAVVKVNGDEATIKRVKIFDGVVILEPESHNKSHRRRIVDENDPDAPSVRLLGRVVWCDLSL